ncbi:TldD/PmbA family protein [Acidithiobacillus sp.]|uniref:TldD/PmbA family protein n=1 Tax=Acidithiobacillus sp. TaxID=1872118 RepID=UPI0025BF0405|nr:TldD/PmbA family protein [Acidithiobacillus sp.]MCK9188468.1 TldD/PmbA family protein [Acidithiobacillus sp.]MCK9358889.1 TldD/PmbA family protein [Acidithiobacillus sp.]
MSSSQSGSGEDLRATARRAAGLLQSLPYWSVLIEESVRLSTSVQRGVAVAPERQMLRAALLTVGSGGNVSYASTTDLSTEGLRRAVIQATQCAEALAAFRLTDMESWPKPNQIGHWRSPGGPGMSLAERFEWLRVLDAALKQSDRIKDRRAGLETVERQRYFLHSAGAEQHQETYLCMPYMQATASDGHEAQSRSYSPYAQGTASAEALTRSGFTVATATRLATEALELLDAPDCPTGITDILLSPEQMTLQIHESIGHPLELDRILGDERNYAGWSFVRQEDFGRLQYGSALLNVVFDPSEAGELAGFGYDDEGTPAQRTHLIRDGILQRPLGGARSAARVGMEPVACARVCDPLRQPIDRMANINLEPGGTSMEDMIAHVEHGIWMSENRSWSIDQRRDKFQFGCEWGRRIENGQLKGWVKNPNYRGRTLDFWKSLIAVGDRASYRVSGTPYCGKGEPNQAITVGHASPACLFRGIETFGGNA